MSALDAAANEPADGRTTHGSATDAATSGMNMSSDQTLRPWYAVVDHDRDNLHVRGPYEHEATAAAVRRELELGHDYYREHGNLWIVEAPRP